MPAPLPPQPGLALSGELQGLLSAADRALGRLDGSVLTPPNPDLFVFMYVRKEAVLSSQIEGPQSSRQDLLAAEARLFDQNLPRDVDEVLNYVRAMKMATRCSNRPPQERSSSLSRSRTRRSSSRYRTSNYQRRRSATSSSRAS